MPKILVVEDSEFVRENLVALLEINNYEVMSAENGQIGFELARHEVPDLIIADIMMPVMNGYELLQQLRNTKATQAIPIIFLTAKTSSSELRFGMNMGADDYISKPYQVEDVLKAVQTRLEKKKEYEKKFESVYDQISLYIPHELRTPLVSIIGFSNLLSEDARTLSPFDIADMAETIKGSAQRLHNTIEKFIILNESQYMLADKNKFEVLLDKITEVSDQLAGYLFRTKVKNLGFDTVGNIKVGQAKIKISYDHFKLIYDELIENAVKFSVRGSLIEVSSFEDEEYFSISVKNAGRGMSKEEIKNIAPLVQHNRKKYEQQGNGLGLPAVKNLMKFFGGDFDLRSEPGVMTEAVVKFKKVD